MHDQTTGPAERVYATLLRVYPRPFRERFGAGMRHAFSNEYRDARGRGVLATAGFWAITIAQAVALGSIERAGARPAHSSSRSAGGSMLTTWTTDARDAWRALRAHPMIAVVAVLSLALGIGANTALFSILNSLVLRTLPVRDPARLAIVEGGPWTNPIWEALRARETHIGEGAFAWSNERFDLSASGVTDFVTGAYVSGRMFEVLGTHAALGRPLTAQDDIRGREQAVAVITYDFWRRRFAAAPDVIGRTITVQRVPITIVGVMERGFFGPDVGRSADVMLPLAAEGLIRAAESRLDHRSSWWLYVMFRLKPGQSAEDATAVLQAMHPVIREETLPPWPVQNLNRYLAEPPSFVEAATGRSPLRDRYQQPLTIIFAVVALVLIVACANLANLQIARATARRRELSLRLALGAGRIRLVRQLLFESLMLAGAGAVLALGVAWWGSRLLVSQIATANAVFLDLALDWRVLAFTSAAGVATALLFGLAPALSVLRISAHEALADHGRRVAGDRRIGLRNGLVVMQVALSLVLLTGALLFARTFVALTTRPLGFNPEPVLVANVNAIRSHVPETRRQALFDRLIEAVARTPGVEAASGSALTPIGGGSWNTEIEIPGGPDLSRRDRSPMVNAVAPGWFATLGMQIREGRDIQHSDRVGTPFVAVVNQAFARRYFPGRSAIGGHVLIEQGTGPKARFDIVGLVDDSVYRSLRDEAPPTMYLSLAQNPDGSSIVITARSRGVAPEAIAKPVTDALMRVDGNLALTLRPLSAQIGTSIAQERLIAMLSGFFGVLALLLSALGLYGVTSFAVNRRRTEIGIRLALGARPASVLRMVLSRVAAMIAIGTVTGVAMGAWLARYVGTLVYGLEPRDPLTFGVAAGSLAVVGLIAAWRPARRAARLDPALTLRD